MARPEAPAPDYAALRAYIEADAETTAPWVEGNNQGIADLLNAPSVAAFVPVASRSLLSFAAATGIFAQITQGRTNPNAAIAAICEAAYIMVSREDTSLDLADPDHLAMVHALATGLVITGDAAAADAGDPDPTAAGTDDLTKIRVLCSALVGYFEANYGRKATLDDIRAVRAS